jgi:hypothetical protein
MTYISDMVGRTGPTTDLKTGILSRIESTPDSVWTPTDFADIGSRHAVDKALQRLVAIGDLRRIDRGLYDQPRLNSLTGKPTMPDSFDRCQKVRAQAPDFRKTRETAVRLF